MSAQIEENVAFVGPLRFWFRQCAGVLEAQSPQYKYSLEWGPNVAHGFNPVSGPPPGALDAFNKLVAHIRSFRPNSNVRLEAGTQVVPVAGKTLPLVAPAPAYPYGDEGIPDPYKLPEQCIPCGDKIYTA